MDAAGRFAYLLGMLVVGVAARQAGLLDDARTERLNAVAFYVVLPALIFVSTYDRRLASLVSPALLVGVPAVVAATAGLAWVLHRRRSEPGRRGVAVVQSYHTNLGYLGFPLVAATFGPTVTATAGLLLGLISLVQITATVLVLVTVADADVSLAGQARELVTNPVLLSLLLAVVVGWAGLPVPDPAVTGLSTVGDVALPLALVLVGASLETDVGEVDPAATGGVVAVKLLWMPLAAWLVFSALGVEAAVLTAAVVMHAMPTAVSTFVYATELGGDPEFASLNVLVTTVASLGTVFALIVWFG